MQISATANYSIHQAIHKTAEDALARRPALAALIDPFVDLLFQKAQCIARLGAHARPGDLQGTHDRLLSGIPVFTTLPLASWQEPLEVAFGWMLMAIREVFPAMGGDIKVITAAYRDGSLQLIWLAEEYLDGSFKHYESAAQFMGLSGDRKFLHCGLCGHNWRINRDLCPACDNIDKDFQIYLAVSDNLGERVDICRKCGLYLPCVDLRERNAMPHFDTAAVCMVHLDILAQQQGFRPLSNLPWNRIEN